MAAGIRRIEAITGGNALEWVRGLNKSVQQAAALLKTSPSELVEKARLAQENIRSLEKELDQLKVKLASAASADLSSQAIDIKGIKVLATVIKGADVKSLRGMVDQLKDKLKTAVVVLATEADGKISVAAGVTADATAKIKAGDLVAHVSTQIGGKGGGRPDMAMGGGSDLQALPGAIESVQAWVEGKV